MIIMSSAVARAADTNSAPAAFFSIHARAEPGVMPRVLELFAKRGLVPSFWHSAVSGNDQRHLTIEIRISGLCHDLTEYIAACLRQIVSVETVLTMRREYGD
jgi:acetolactate synthase small subunit